MADDRPAITQQYSFAVGDDGETDGAIEPAEESVETSLETWGASVDHRERDTRIEQPEASSFGVDDRPEVTSNDGGEQGALFADTTDDQQTLTGERAASQCLFESDDTPDEQDHDRDDHADEASPRAVATDGGQPVEEDDDSDGSHEFAVGARVEDRDADDPNPAVVIALPDEPAYAREIPALDGKSVADVNPEYGAGGPVATVAYAEDLDIALDVWREADPDALAQICADYEVRTYDFPTARLRETTMSDGGRAKNDEPTDTDEQDADDHDEGDDRDDEADESPDEGEDTTFDPDAETVTEAWEGAFITASWGYDQTNVELAQIVEVSGSGKTVLARMVVAERVGHGRNNTQLRPTAEQYGDEFRLHVRSPNGKPAFRGTYPLSNDGDMDDGPTRRESFYPFDNDPENSVRRTAINHGH
jgi:hypothetical protein